MLIFIDLFQETRFLSGYYYFILFYFHGLKGCDLETKNSVIRE